MRAVIIGASALGVMTARSITNRGHEVVIVELEQQRIEALSASLDCGFVNGDGTKPAILKETDPGDTDILYCLTGNDQTNIIASLVGRSLGFPRVITGIKDPEFEHICIELALADTIIPARSIGRLLAEMLEGRDPLELSTMIRDEARVFSFVARAEDAGKIAELALPDHCRIICLYRAKELIIPGDDDPIKAEDEVVVITRRDELKTLRERWGPEHQIDTNSTRGGAAL